MIYQLPIPLEADRYYTTVEIMQAYQCKRSIVYELMKSGKLPYINSEKVVGVGTQRLILGQDITKCFQNLYQKQQNRKKKVARDVAGIVNKYYSRHINSKKRWVRNKETWNEMTPEEKAERKAKKEQQRAERYAGKTFTPVELAHIPRYNKNGKLLCCAKASAHEGLCERTAMVGSNKCHMHTKGGWRKKALLEIGALTGKDYSALISKMENIKGTGITKQAQLEDMLTNELAELYKSFDKTPMDLINEQIFLNHSRIQRLVAKIMELEKQEEEALKNASDSIENGMLRTGGTVKYRYDEFGKRVRETDTESFVDYNKRRVELEKELNAAQSLMSKLVADKDNLERREGEKDDKGVNEIIFTVVPEQEAIEK